MPPVPRSKTNQRHAGTQWLEESSIPQAKRVLYMDEEMSERLLRRKKGEIRVVPMTPAV